MADCEFVLPCESVIASADELLSIENTGGGGAIKARSTSQPSVQATSNDGVAIVGASFGNHGILGLSNPDNPDNSTSAGVFGIAKGFSGFSPMATGVSGSSRSAPGIVGGSQDNVGVVGRSKTDDGVLGLSESDVESGDYLLSWQREGSGLRYVCSIDVDQTAALVDEAGLAIENQFRSDGREGNLNLYTICEKRV